MNNKAGLLLIVSLWNAIFLSGCKPSDISNTNNASSSYEETNGNQIIENGVAVNLTGYPIVNQPITLKTVVVTSYKGDYNQSKFFQELEKKSGIHLEIKQVSVDNRDILNLIFSSRQYPDLLLRSDASPYQITIAQNNGDIIPFSSLLQYAPNWIKVLESNPTARKAMTAPDGSIYSLGLIQQNPVYLGIRDQWLINKKWLDQIGAEVPATTEQFASVLAQFKANAGVGDIPKDMIPYYFRWDQYVGGQLDLYGGSFGILVPDDNYVSVENGKVRFQALNPEIKKPLAYLHRLYKEGLIPPEVFTDDWGAYYAKLVNKPEMVGAIAAYGNPNSDVYVPMLPPKAEGTQEQLYRRQTWIVRTNQFTLFKNNKYPIASARLADLLADPDWSVQETYGLFGAGTKKNSDGTYDILPETANDGGVPNVDAVSAITPDLASKLRFLPGNSNNNRSQAVKMYEPIVAPLDKFFPDYVAYSADDRDKLTQLQMNVRDYVRQTFIRWVVQGGIDQEWDAYIAKLKSMHVDDMIVIMQKGLDDYNKQ
ncbi:hypothetical protein [Paenibacillus sp. OAS669]|uniref:hypothetical protein n=1 Tax=Paenibacillus sp. OAS669 TaxID=2663821 RepID=UPI00178A1DEA|nr:hypothetical protein [Paenibacillus sp. OAS669]MBE1445889.1 putative aldouronate transport system substrate-binding protein [Paenibacillus sp. OAS669]